MANGEEKSAGGGVGDLYAVLGLKKECSEAELKNAYKKLALVWCFLFRFDLNFICSRPSHGINYLVFGETWYELKLSMGLLGTLLLRTVFGMMIQFLLLWIEIKPSNLINCKLIKVKS